MVLSLHTVETMNVIGQQRIHFTKTPTQEENAVLFCYCKWTLSVVDGIQTACEDFLIKQFEDSLLLVIHAKRVTVIPRDFVLISCIKFANTRLQDILKQGSGAQSGPRESSPTCEHPTIEKQTRAKKLPAPKKLRKVDSAQIKKSHSALRKMHANLEEITFKIPLEFFFEYEDEDEDLHLGFCFFPTRL
ncbi:hypothetical protein O6H91_01G065300 [Diphasiastrum complanatum]|uniref:Uncharacterized protein n=1 Tax=Diphasiastrum complanatum TaxID=34168 RepID=A0ACC2ERH1_DIPCM|nr:hypothetical protein O6H91_01G065300 [Diphasiastrum complanatum]